MEAFKSVDFDRFGIFNLKLNPDARIMVAPYLFKNPGNLGQDSTSGCPRLTQCGFDVTCTGTLVLTRTPCEYTVQNYVVRRPDARALAPAPAHAANENPQALILPRQVNAAPHEGGHGGGAPLQGNQGGDPVNLPLNHNFLEVASAVAIPRPAHVPRVKINPALGPFGAYQYSVRPFEEMCQLYAPLTPPLEGERLLNPAWQVFDNNEHAKSDEERYNIFMRPLA